MGHWIWFSAPRFRHNFCHAVHSSRTILDKRNGGVSKMPQFSSWCSLIVLTSHVTSHPRSESIWTNSPFKVAFGIACTMNFVCSIFPDCRLWIENSASSHHLSSAWMTETRGFSNITSTAAVVICSSRGSKCNGTHIRGSNHSNDRIKIYLRSEVFNSSSGSNTCPALTTAEPVPLVWAKPLPPPPALLSFVSITRSPFPSSPLPVSPPTLNPLQPPI